jgi:predicted nucleic acid-binding protein
MSVLVLDASIVVDLLGRFAPAPLEKLLFAPGAVMVAPALLDIEVMQALRRLESVGSIPESRRDQLITVLQGLRIRRFPHEPLLDTIWQLRKNLTAYDATYVALARTLSAPLVTRDLRLARAPDLGVQSASAWSPKVLVLVPLCV